MNQHATSTPDRILSTAQAVLQRKCSGSCRGEVDKNMKILQRKASSNHEASEVPPIVYDVLRSPGQPLSAETRAYFEPRLGHDFSRVRVHTDQRAAESAKRINARAYTVGSVIAFGPGEFSTGSVDGRRLLAHELTHVVQQARQITDAPLSIGATNSLSEHEAEFVSKVLDMSEVDFTKTLVKHVSLSGKLARQSNGAHSVTSREQLLEAIRLSLGKSDYKDVALRLNGLSRGDIVQQLRTFSPEQRLSTYKAWRNHFRSWPDTISSPMLEVAPDAVVDDRGNKLQPQSYDAEVGSVVASFNQRLKPPTPLDPDLVRAMLRVESGTTPSALRFDPLQVANKGDKALTVLRDGSKNEDPRILHKIWGERKIVLANKTVTPRDTSGQYWDYAAVPSNQRIDSTSSIQAGVAWLFRNAVNARFVPTRVDGTAISYTVKRGDSLSSIASQHDSIDKLIISENPDQDLKKLKPGMVIKVPKGELSVHFEWKDWFKAVEAYNGNPKNTYLDKVKRELAKLKGGG